jgi:hypothetical protein
MLLDLPEHLPGRAGKHDAGLDRGFDRHAGALAEEIFRASWPFVSLIVLGMVILAIFPDLVTVLPNLTRPR